MAPKRKPAAAAAAGATRKSPRLANIAVAPPAGDPAPRKAKKSKTLAAAAKEAPETEAPAEENPAPAPEPKKGKKSKAATPAAKEDSEAEAPPPAVAAAKTVVIEHCKQCNSFKTRAIQVKLGLEKGVAGVSVVVNPEKPRRGCFEIREEGGGIFVSLLDLKRPFTPMKELDMEKVISDIVEKLK